MKNNEKYKKAFNEIYVSKKLESNILNMTVNKKKKKNIYFKLAYVGCLTFVICSLLTVVYANEIKEFFQNWSASINFDNGSKISITENSTFKKIPSNAKKQGKNESLISMTHNEIEKMLGFHILNYDKTSSDVLLYGTALNSDGSIGRVDLWWPTFIKGNKSISILISMLNENADSGLVLAFKEGADATGGKNLSNTHSIDNISTKVIIYSSDWDKKRLTATFVYDNILYTLIGENFTEAEILDIIKNLK